MKKFINPTIALCGLDSTDVIRTSQPMNIGGQNEEDLAPRRENAAAAVNPVKPEPNSLPH